MDDPYSIQPFRTSTSGSLRTSCRKNIQHSLPQNGKRKILAVTAHTVRHRQSAVVSQHCLHHQDPCCSGKHFFCRRRKHVKSESDTMQFASKQRCSRCKVIGHSDTKCDKWSIEETIKFCMDGAREAEEEADRVAELMKLHAINTDDAAMKAAANAQSTVVTLPSRRLCGMPTTAVCKILAFSL